MQDKKQELLQDLDIAVTLNVLGMERRGLVKMREVLKAFRELEMYRETDTLRAGGEVRLECGDDFVTYKMVMQ